MDPGNDLLSRQKPLSSASVVSRPCSRWERVGPTDYVHREYWATLRRARLVGSAESWVLSPEKQASSSTAGIAEEGNIKKGDAKTLCEQLDLVVKQECGQCGQAIDD